jgi:acyl-CoA dehydrogenase
MPVLAKLWMGAPMLAVADGPTEVHKVQIAKALLKNAKPAPGMFPSEYLPDRLAAARAQYAQFLGD